MKLKLGIHTYDISFYICFIYVFYCQCPTAFFAMTTFKKFPLTYGDAVFFFTELLIEKLSIFHKTVVQIALFHWLPEQQ